MTTPTDDEIVAHLRKTYGGGFFLDEAIREALRLAREGLPVPVKDEAEALWEAVFANGPTVLTGDAVATIRAFLATRDAERDVAVAELVTAVKEVIDDTPAVWANMRLVPALAKLERKP
jgi:hypothetical protein